MLAVSCKVGGKLRPGSHILKLTEDLIHSLLNPVAFFALSFIHLFVVTQPDRRHLLVLQLSLELVHLQLESLQTHFAQKFVVVLKFVDSSHQNLDLALYRKSSHRRVVARYVQILSLEAPVLFPQATHLALF